jgi:hypothetical protein
LNSQSNGKNKTGHRTRHWKMLRQD